MRVGSLDYQNSNGTAVFLLLRLQIPVSDYSDLIPIPLIAFFRISAVI